MKNLFRVQTTRSKTYSKFAGIALKQTICFLIICLPLLSMSQGDTTTGIKWTTGLSWEQVKQKAKAESKYIFVDAYTTWCAPCKMMDKFVYPNDTVGRLFNEKFISIKAQMDVTDKDDQFIKDWYNDATVIKKEYIVEGFPSLIFISPEGNILHKEEGFRSVDKLVEAARIAMRPGKIYEDQYAEYKKLVNDYYKGIKHYGMFPSMIKIALKVDDVDFAKQLAIEHSNYADGLSKSDRYTKENIELWASFNLGSNSKVFKFFYRDGEEIDLVMDKRGFASNVVDQTIIKEIVIPFLQNEDKQGIMTRSANLVEVDQNMNIKYKRDSSNVDWKKLNKIVQEKFNKSYAKRSLLSAKIYWYSRHQNLPVAAKYYFIKLENYPPKMDQSTAISINGFAWPTFLYVTEKKQLKLAIKWMGKAIQEVPEDNLIDTYANLLYKIGRRKDAILWEEKALSVTNPLDERKKKIYIEVIDSMKKGKQTYLKDGAIW